MTDPFTPGLLARLPEPPRKVAIVRASRIGDFICATPAIRALAAALPGAEITLIGLPFLRDMVERSPYLAHYVEFPGFPGLADQFFDARGALRFFAEMQAQAFDLALQMNGSGVYSNPFTLMLGARTTAGFVRPNDPPGRLDAALPMPTTGHEIERMLALTTFLGAPPVGCDGAQPAAPEFPLWDEDQAAADALLAGAEPPLIGLHPAAREATKRWAPERFGRLGVGLWRQHRGTLVIVGGPDEGALAAAVVRAVAESDRAIPCRNLAGRTTLGSLGAVISRLAVFITNDSGPAHVAYALGVPSVTVFGGTDPAHWGPPPGPQFRVITNPVPCWPCDYWVCPVGYLCLEGITVDEVAAAAEAVWAVGTEVRCLPRY
jgi:ADP-heptose:LPS heptosyltransferase